MSDGTASKSSKATAQPSLKLYYFDFTGKAECIRLLAAYAGLTLEDYRFADRDEFAKLKADGTLPFGQVPMLEVNGTDRVPQTAAILRYLAKVGGGDDCGGREIYPSDPLLAAKVDAALDQEADAFVGATVASYTSRFGIDMNDDQVKAAAALLSSEVMPRHLGAIEAQLSKAGGTGWIAGTPGPSPADFAWALRLGDYLPMKDRLFTAEVRGLEAFPECRAFVKRFYELPEIVEYYASREKK